MASRFHSEFPEKRVTAPAKGPVNKHGPKGAEASGMRLKEKTANWKTPSPTKGSNFNRRTKMPVLKAKPKKAGVD